MKCCVLVVIGLSSCFGNCQAKYKAALFDYHPTKKKTPEDTIVKNFEIYKKQIENAAKEKVDIIVFPEYGLTTLFANPKDYALEVLSDGTQLIKELYSLAAKYHIYIVVNLLEKIQDLNGPKYYNTNLVFARNGTIIARYRKINVSLNESKLLTPGNDTVTFKTDFGITFGLLTSSDLISQKGLDNNRVDEKITDVVCVTSPLQFTRTSAMNLQRGFAIANNVNLLVAGYKRSNNLYGGSGIFWANKRILEDYGRHAKGNKLIIKDVDPFASKDNNFNIKEVAWAIILGTCTALIIIIIYLSFLLHLKPFRRELQ